MRNYIINLWWGGDPDHPDSFSELSLRDIHHVQKTWAPVYAQSGIYGMEMFLRFFRKDPSSKTFFKAIKNMNEEEISSSYQFKAHVENFMASINSCIIHLKEPKVVAALMNKLGESHHGRQIEKIYFEGLKEIWIDLMKNDLVMKKQIIDSWIKFINFIFKHIFDKLNGSS